MHVNYTKGMVLGVDDFTQEFVYLSGRDRWITRELLGYGTISGLALLAEDTNDGPRLRVTRGSAAVPSGKLVCVAADQCGLINAWLAKKENGDQVTRIIAGGSPPLSPPMPPPSPVTISLYLTLCFADCLTAPVPIPGEPCRSEDSLMAPSRVADYFRLELRTEAPLQTEEDSLRDFVAWLRQVPIVDSSPPPAADEVAWIAGLHAAARPWFDALSAASPPLSPPAIFAALHDYMFDSPPTALRIPRGHLGDFLRVAFRFWATELRPLWMGSHCDAMPGGGSDCLLLGRIDVPIVWVGGSPVGAWEAAGNAATIGIVEGRRPYLVHMRLLQEWLLAGEDDAQPATPPVSGQALTPTSRPTFAGLTTTGAVNIALATTGANLTLDATHHCIICTGAVTLTLPKCGPATRGRVYIVRATAGVCPVALAAGDTVSGLPAAGIGSGTVATLISDGVSGWHLIASTTS
jgi:hypothetical protein